MRDKEGEMEATGCRKRERCWWNWGWERNGIAKRWERSNNGAKLTTAIAKREEKLWKEEVKKKPKLRTYLVLKTKLSFEPYLTCGESLRRSLMTQLRVGTNTLNIERAVGIARVEESMFDKPSRRRKVQ